MSKLPSVGPTGPSISLKSLETPLNSRTCSRGRAISQLRSVSRFALSGWRRLPCVRVRCSPLSSGQSRSGSGPFATRLLGESRQCVDALSAAREEVEREAPVDARAGYVTSAYIGSEPVGASSASANLPRRRRSCAMP